MLPLSRVELKSMTYLYSRLSNMRCRHQVGSSARFVPHKVYEALDERTMNLTKHDTVYLLDYCGPPGFVERLGKLASRHV
jgi:hypothetical protein